MGLLSIQPNQFSRPLMPQPKAQTFDEVQALRFLAIYYAEPTEPHFLRFVECATPLFQILLERSGLRPYRSAQEWNQELLVLIDRLLKLYDPARKSRLFYFLRVVFRRYFFKERNRLLRQRRELPCSALQIEKYFSFGQPVIIGYRSFARFDSHPYWYR
jgi:hypothetical protein